jgi:hypothetical protein
LGHPKVAGSTPKVELVEPLIFFFLVSDIGSDGFLIIAHCVQEKPSRPEMLAHEVAFAFPVDLRQMNPITCGSAYLGGIEIIMCT